MKVNYNLVPFPESSEYDKVFHTVFKSYEDDFDSKSDIESVTVERIMNFTKVTGDHLHWLSIELPQNEELLNGKNNDIVNIFLSKDESLLENLTETFKIN